MMYSKGFVVTIKNDRGQVLRESRDREVFLPFNSNYSILLKNNNNRRALAEIKIDGTYVLGSQRIIVPAHGSVDVERFCIDGNLQEGRKFEFVKATDERVQDPTSNFNGFVQIKFWLEKEQKMPDWVMPVIPVKPWNPPYITPYTWKIGDFPAPVYYSENQPTGISGFSTMRKMCSFDGGTRSSTGQPVASCGSAQTFNFAEDKGATVEGGYSNQSFTEGNIGELELNYTEITLKLKPSKEAVTVKQTRKLYCSNCGDKVKLADKFCSKCGNKL